MKKGCLSLFLVLPIFLFSQLIAKNELKGLKQSPNNIDRFYLSNDMEGSSKCYELKEGIIDFVKSEIVTNNNLINYLNENSAVWSQAHMLVMNKKLKIKNYNGGMKINSEASAKNANALTKRNVFLKEFQVDLLEVLDQCLESNSTTKR